MVTTFCKGIGSKRSIKPSILGCLSELEDSIANYYNVLIL